VKESIPEAVKVVALWAVTAFHWMTDGLPAMIAWATLAYTVLKIYVVVRDEVMKRKDG
jgi:hypothetical protein